jgi:CRISPR-associated endoribonuclease Cas6
MRFKLTLNRIGKQRMLPVDYQYYIGSWIYKVIGQADSDFAQFLHEQGYTLGSKQFKLFNYSPLSLGKPVLWKERSLFEVISDQIILQISFVVPEAAEHFIVGLFNNQELFIGDKFNGLDLRVAQIERLSEIGIFPIMHYRALSPVVISVQNEGDRYAQYLSPEDKEYATLIKNNLLNKWKSLPDLKLLHDEMHFRFSLKSIGKSRLITLKPGAPQQSRVRGYLFDFSLEAPAELHRFLLSAGIGEKNSTGFGWCEPQIVSQT